MNRAVFLDRDGTINVDHGYIKSPEQFMFLPNAVSGLRRFSELGFLLIIVSNQSGIGRGLYSLNDYYQVTERMITLLKDEEIVIHDIFFCPHSPESRCPCRKPSPQMILDAVSKWNVDVSSSFLIGDKESDIQAGLRVGLKTMLLSQQKNTTLQTETVTDLLEAADLIEKAAHSGTIQLSAQP
jgi:D-glycero-D-manno-heptose 1,7-bisphosphate phosphatase